MKALSRVPSSSALHTEGERVRSGQGLKVLLGARLARELALSSLSGALVALAIAEFDIWLFAWFGLVPLMLAVEGAASSRRAFVLGLAAGLVTNLLGLYWLVDLLTRFGPMATPWAALIYVVFCAYQGLVFALFAWLIHRLRSRLTVRGRALPLLLLAPPVMVLCELLLPFVFPWNLAMTQAWVPRAIQLAELTGPTGVTALLMMTNGALCDALVNHEHRFRSPMLALGVLGVVLAGGEWRMQQLGAAEQAAPKLKVGVVQANFGVGEPTGGPASQRKLEALQRTSQELAQRGAELLLWTETVYPYALPGSLSSDFAPAHPQRVRRGFDTPLLFGAASFDPGAHSQAQHPTLKNSAFFLDGAGQVGGRYDKNELVAFGERVPFDDTLPFLRSLRLASAGQFVGGDEVRAFTLRHAEQAFRLAPMICLEDIFPAFGRRVAALHPHLLVNLTNDAWFGPTSEPAQHMALAVFRSVEQRAAMVRAVNTGPSSFIDSTGTVHARSERASEHGAARPPEGLLLEVPLMEGGHTFYARHGNVFANVCAVLALLGLALTLGQRGALAHARALLCAAQRRKP